MFAVLLLWFFLLQKICFLTNIFLATTFTCAEATLSGPIVHAMHLFERYICASTSRFKILPIHPLSHYITSFRSSISPHHNTYFIFHMDGRLYAKSRWSKPVETIPPIQCNIEYLPFKPRHQTIKLTVFRITLYRSVGSHSHVPQIYGNNNQNWFGRGHLQLQNQSIGN